MANHAGSELAHIGAETATTAQSSFREMTVSELSRHSFSDYFRFSFTMRMDRDEALAMAAKIEAYVNEIKNTHDRPVIYVGVLNRD